MRPSDAPRRLVALADRAIELREPFAFGLVALVVAVSAVIVWRRR